MLKKTSTSQIVFFSVFLIIFFVHNFVLQPMIRETYLSSDLKNFEESSWKYTVIVFFALLSLMFFLTIKSKIKDLSNLPIAIFVLGLSCFAGLHRPINDLLLYINMKVEKGRNSKEYKVVNHQDYKTFWLNGKTSIHDNNDLNKVNTFRLKKKLKPIFEMNTNDTVLVPLRRGLINIDYLY
ncbi:hypothetical protein PFY10_04955 [Chryseobacterium daecheongense]|nr:hypothetical protein PFY10_04955 [Chryseobacterium daecheongense]